MPRKTLTIIGILLVLIQISGVPHSWKTFFGILVGIYLVVIAVRGSQDMETGLELKNKPDGQSSSDGDLKEKENTTSYDAKTDKGN